MNAELLTRIAEAIYWTGRYVERADDTARLVDVYVHRMLGETGADSDAACRALFGILGVQVEPGSELDVDVVLFRLVFETQSSSAIAGSMLGARAGAVVGKRMALAIGAAPPPGAAVFRDLDNQAAGGALRHRHPGDCGTRETERQCRRQQQCLCHSSAPCSSAPMTVHRSRATLTVARQETQSRGHS